MKKLLLLLGIIFILAFSMLAVAKYQSRINGEEIDADDGGYKVNLSKHDYWGEGGGAGGGGAGGGGAGGGGN